MTGPTLRLVLAEDNEADAELVSLELRRAGLEVSLQVVDTEEAFIRAIRAFGPDVILSDFSMPGFDGMAALRLARELVPETPFIFVSGTLGEGSAIRALKNGATDYIVKTNLARLSAAVERAAAEAQIHRERLRVLTELEVARERLAEREAGLTRAQDVAKLAHVITGTQGTFRSWSDSLPKLLGVDAREVPHTTSDWIDFIHPDDREHFRAKAIEARRTNQRTEVDYRLRHSNGKWIHVRQVMELLESKDKTTGGSRWFNTLQDVTGHKVAEARVKRLNRVYAVLSGINSLIVRVQKREELFQEACRVAVDVGHFRMAWLGLYDTIRHVVAPVAWHGHEEGFLRLMSLSMADPQPEGRGLVRRAIRDKHPTIINDTGQDPKFRLRNEAQSRGYGAAAVLPLIVASEVKGVLGLFAEEPGFFDDDEMRLLTELAGDISFAMDHIDKAEKLDYLAYYDGLTGLPNRTLFLERLTQQIHSTTESQTKVAVVLSDLERFRAVNDSLGRAMGDLLLSEFAQRLAKGASGMDHLARIGADQFAIVLPNMKSELECVHRLGDIAKSALGEPFHIGGQDLHIAAKAGIALFPHHGTDADTLLRNAEAALRRCKQTGERRLFYEEAMTARVAETLSLESKLRRAVEREEFILHYQPKVSLGTRQVTGLEALIRWKTDDRLVPPASFIPLLEETGLILEVGEWALYQAVRQHREWLEQGMQAPAIAVNVSAVQLRQRDFVARVKRILAGGPTRPNIELEITESMIMDDITGTIEKLRAIRDLGVHVAIDDFGTGYSSLAYLAKLPVTTLKIDRSFIITMLKDPNVMTLVSTMVSLARSLKLKVVAEGVDQEEQAKVLHELGCDEMQGYLFSKPLSPDDLRPLLTGK